MRVSHGLLAATLASTVLLGGCALFEGKPVTPTQSQQVVIASGRYAFEATYNLAANAYLADQASASPVLKGVAKAQAKGDLLAILNCHGNVDGSEVCTGYLPLARKAAKVGDETTLAAQVTQITKLAADVNTLIHGGTP